MIEETNKSILSNFEFLQKEFSRIRSKRELYEVGNNTKFFCSELIKVFAIGPNLINIAH